MKETTQQLFDRAIDTIEAAEILLTNGWSPLSIKGRLAIMPSIQMCKAM
jgi:hypothetical protein